MTYPPVERVVLKALKVFAGHEVGEMWSLPWDEGQRILKDASIAEVILDEDTRQEVIRQDEKLEEERKQRLISTFLRPLKRSKSAKLMDMIDRSDIEFVRDQFNEAYAIFEVGEHREVHALKSRYFKCWVAKQFNEEYDDIVSDSSINGAITTLSGRAYFQDKQITLNLRVAEYDGSIYYDLCDDTWDVIRISRDGWARITPDVALFKRHPHMRGQQDPIHGGDVKKLLPYFNLKGASEEAEQLLLVTAVSFFLPGIPHPALNIHGAHGSAKSTAFRMLRRVIDPSELELLSLPKDSNELIQKMSHHWCCFFDNITRLGDDTSDVLCRAVTGEGFSKRVLFSDDDDMLYKYRRCLGLNGINIPAQKSDLLDRSILLELERIPKSLRRDEERLYQDFDADKQEIVGGIFDVLVKAMIIVPSVKPVELPRMADYAIWGEAISQAIGYDNGSFLDVYNKNLSRQNAAALEAHIIGAPLLNLLDDRREVKSPDTIVWEGTATELLEELETRAQRLRINTREAAWPKAPNALTRSLGDIKANLLEEGYQVVKDKLGKKRTRTIVICDVQKISSFASSQSAQADDKKTTPNISSAKASAMEYTKKEAISTNETEADDKDDMDAIPSNLDSIDNPNGYLSPDAVKKGGGSP